MSKHCLLVLLQCLGQTLGDLSLFRLQPYTFCCNIFCFRWCTKTSMKESFKFRLRRRPAWTIMLRWIDHPCYQHAKCFDVALSICKIRWLVFSLDLCTTPFLSRWHQVMIFVLIVLLGIVLCYTLISRHIVFTLYMTTVEMLSCFVCARSMECCASLAVS